MHSGINRTLAASPHIRKYKDIKISFLFLLIASMLQILQNVNPKEIRYIEVEYTYFIVNILSLPIPCNSDTQIFAPLNIIG